MKQPPEAYRESVCFAQPLRDAAISRSGDRQAIQQQDLQASYERGRVDGERALGEQLLRQRSAVADLQNGILASLRNAVPEVIRDCEDALVALAVEVAEKLVAGLPVDSAMVKASVQAALAQAADTAEMTIQVHPADLALLQASPSSPLEQSGTTRIQFVPASNVSRGGCVAQTRFGIVDARRETRAQLIRQSLGIPPAQAETSAHGQASPSDSVRPTEVEPQALQP